MFSLSPDRRVASLWVLSWILFFVTTASLFAEGTPNLRTADGDPVLLFVGEEDFGDFASYDGPENSRLNFRIGTAGETVYFGMARLYKNSGVPETFGQYKFRVRSAVDGAVVFGPITVNANNENLTSYAQAEIGPDVLGVGGYPTDEDYTFIAPEAGEYYVEFEQNNVGRPRYIGLWDITIVNEGVEQTGRVYSKNWAFRVPELDPELPECAFGAELSTVFYSYTSDGFVTMIDFRNSGFQPLSFNLAFNRTGPGETGDLILDRMSIPENNATANAAEHLIFLSEPDPILFPDGECGSVEVSGEIQCQAEDTFCIPVESTLSGQVEIVLDFNGNGLYDEEIDRLLLYAFNQERGFSACVPWDGLRGDGERPEDGATVDILVQYTQGLQHWALYDGELMRNGFCVTPIRPICGGGGDAALYYDDSNIPDDPGTDAPKKVIDGCDCGTPACRTWTNFEANAADDCTIINANTTGYGDRNTLNTWWFASSISLASFDVPVSVASLDGPKDHCPDELVVISLTYNSQNAISEINWFGPDGPIVTSPGQTDITTGQTGLYTVSVTDEFGCASEAEFTLMDVECMLNVNILSVECQDGGTDTDPNDDVFFAQVLVEGEGDEGYRYNGITRNYGEEITIGPFFIIDGDVTFTATDNQFDCCQESIVIPAPMSCSDGCAITLASIQETTCLDNGTPTDPTDDQFTFTMIIDGVNLGSNWINDRGDTGPYGEPLQFGPFPISAGAQDFQFTDVSDPDCVIFATVQAPNHCSSDCELIPTVTNVVCADAGTPFDPSDDTYTFDLLVSGNNTPSVAYSLNGNGAFLYDQTNTFGPFQIIGDDFTFFIEDLGGNTCFLEFTLEETPMTCSDACGVEIVDAIVTCDDQGTEDLADDNLFIEILVSTQNPGSTGWTTTDGVTGGFGEYVRVASIAPGGETVTVSISDNGNENCTASTEVTSPEIEILCPEDVATIAHEATLQTFRDSILETSDFTAGDQEVCWLAAETFGAARRYFQRYTLERTSEIPEQRLFSFYLYALPENDFHGAVFSQMGEEELDCCNLSNDGPVNALPTNNRSLPVIPAALQPAGLVLQQSFSVSLRAEEEYSLITSSPTPGITGEYVWLIVSADQEELLIDRAPGLAPLQTFEEVSVSFDLLTSEVADVLNETSSLEIFGAPTFAALCGTADIAFTDAIDSTCDSAQILRTFDLLVAGSTVAEACEQAIEFRNLGIMDITWPAHQVQFGCDAAYPVLENGHPHPDYTGYPFVYLEGVATPLDGPELIDLRISFADFAELQPDGGTNITRTWTVIDLCRQVSATYEQLFKLDSNGQPFFTCPENNHFCPIVEEDIMLWAVGTFECTADVLIPEPALNNVCDTTGWTFITEVLAIQPNGDTVLYTTLNLGDDRLLTDLIPGDYLMRFIGTHSQETIDDQICRFRVADLTEPVAVCKSTINLSIPGNGVITINTSILNQGSYDNCGIVLEELRRQLPEGHPEADSLGWSPWTNVLAFDCEDVGFEWEVQFRITDAAGNTNFCTSYVTVTDNTDPYCVGLEEQFISCDDLPDGFSAFDTTQLRMLFGMPEVIDNCSAQAVELAPTVAGDDCSPDWIQRRFQAIDQHGNLSAGIFTQDVNITPSLGYAIEFPADLDTDCSDLVDTLRIIGTGCDSITVSYVDIPLPTQGEECRYFQRTFTVTNWCEWNGVSPAIAIGRDEDCDGMQAEVPVWLVRTNEGIFVDGDSLITNAFPAADVRGPLCGGENPEGYFRQEESTNGGRYTYNQRIKIFDTVAPELTLSMLDTLCVDTSFCRTLVTVGIAVNDACQIEEGELLINIDFNNDGVFEATSGTLGTLSGSFPNYTFSVNMPIGDHRFEFVTTDDCGNTGIQEQAFRVNDCYVPALVCRGDRIYNLEAVLEPGDIDGDGIVEEAAALVEAVELARCNFEDCSGSLTFSVNRVGEPADRDQSTMFLDCQDRYTVQLELYVWDEAFNPFSVQPDGSVGGNNWRMCEVTVFVQDPSLVCNDCAVEDNITINGEINTLSGEPMTAITVVAGGDAGTTETDVFGNYQLGGTLGSTYELRAEIAADPRAGISTLDILILQYHLLGLQTITDPYLLLAADVNRDGELSALDLVALQGLVLSREEFFPAGSPWRFVPADWDGTGNPSETIMLTELQDCTFDHDFVGIKLGDLNNTLGANAGAGDGLLAGSVGRSRPESFLVADQDITPGMEVTVRVTLPEAAAYAGGQAGFSWNRRALTLLDYQSANLAADNMHQHSNRLLMSWKEQLTSSEVVTISFRTNATGKLSDFIQLEDAADFRDEIYQPNLTVHPVFLRWTNPTEVVVATADEGAEGEADLRPFGLLGVFPNPVNTTTRIGINAAVAQRAKLRVMDITGRVVLEASPLLIEGEQWIMVDARDWPAGTYSFTLETKEGLSSGKLLKQGNPAK